MADEQSTIAEKIDRELEPRKVVAEQMPDFVIVTGMSGAGRTEAMHVFEDLGYFCVDNLPSSLLGDLVRVNEETESTDDRRRLAVVCDSRNGDFFGDLEAELAAMEEAGISYKTLFLDAADDKLIARYKSSRRRHPLCTDGTTIWQGIQRERHLLMGLRDRADFVIDTSGYSPAQLKGRVAELFLTSAADSLFVHAISFGFKFGIPMEADLVFDVRCLPNPFYDEVLRPKTGLDPDVRDYVMENDECRGFVERYTGMLDYLLPLYRKEGKSQLVVAVGCTGGHHRSVALAQFTCDYCSGKGVKASVTHRDIQKF